MASSVSRKGVNKKNIYSHHLVLVHVSYSYYSNTTRNSLPIKNIQYCIDTPKKK